MFNSSLSGKMAGRGVLLVKRGNGDLEKYSDNNKLLASFFTKIHTGAAFAITPRLKVGTGTIANEPATTQLAAVLAPTTGSWPTGSLVEEPVATVINAGTTLRAYIKYQFAAAVGAFVGNISEYGLNLSNDSTTSSGIVDTRVLITDVDGNPTTITLGPLDQLICEYTFEVMFQYSDMVATISANEDGSPVSYEVTTRLAKLSKFSSYMNLSAANTSSGQTVHMTQVPIGDIGVGLPNSNDTTQDTYVGGPCVGNGTNRVFSVDIPTVKGNLVGGIAGLSVGSKDNWYKIGFNPPLPKALNKNIKFNINLSYSQQ